MNHKLKVDIPARRQLGLDRQVHILNLGAGVQSTALALLFDNGNVVDMEDAPIKLAAAIFADTGEEPEAVYRHLNWLLRTVSAYPILIRSKVVSLGDSLMRGENSTGQRFVSIPAFTKGDGDARVGRLRRQCSKEYKVDVIEQSIRRDLLGLPGGSRMPNRTQIVQYLGISLDEAGRAARLVQRQMASMGKTYQGLNAAGRWAYRFPLVDNQWTRLDCQRYLKPLVPHETPRSACVFCPYHDSADWRRLRDNDPAGWSRALEIDAALRTPGLIVQRDLDKPLYLHRSCQPLALVGFDSPPANPPRPAGGTMNEECEGVCGV